MEELLQVEVTSATKRPRAIADTPAAIAVLTAEDLRRLPARTLPEALRAVPGLHVARFDSRTWAVSARGMNQQTSNKMLVLVDGRSVYTPLFSGVFWDVQTPLLEDVARIEVVRGAEATLWGANAVNGVINVITADAAATQGGLVTAGAGDEARFGGARWGGRLGDGHYRLSARYDSLDALALPDGRSAEDPLRLGRASFRADVPAGEADLTFLADAYSGTIGHRQLDDSDVDGASAQARWRRTLAGGSELAVLVWYDHSFRRVPGQFQEERDTADVELLHRWRRGRHDLLWGGGWRRSDDSVRSSAVFAWEPERESVTIGNLFVQDEVRLGQRWRLTGGLRLEDQSTMDPEVLPGIALAWDVAAGQLLWLSADRAVRAPTRLDRDVRIPGQPPTLVRGSRDFLPEEALSYDVGWRSSDFSIDASVELVLFHTEYDRLRSQEPSPTGLPLVISNRLAGTVSGASVAGSVAATRWLELHAGVTFLDTDLEPERDSRDPTRGAAEANDPDHFGHLRAELTLPRDVELTALLRRVGELPSPHVPAYTELDLRLAWAVRPQLELAVAGENLLHDRHPELGSAIARDEVERGVYVQLSWRFR
jgi:iron complex outermembrane receptor protein